MYHEYEFNNYYHSSQDIIANMDVDYSTRNTRLITATLGELAEAQILNYPPDTPGQPNGPTQGVTNKELTFSGVTTDPEGEQIYYKFYWGDNTSSYWVGPYDSGVAGEASHVWTDPGEYDIRVKAKDINERESDWSIPLTVTIVEGPILDMGLIRKNQCPT